MNRLAALWLMLGLGMAAVATGASSEGTLPFELLVHNVPTAEGMRTRVTAIVAGPPRGRGDLYRTLRVDGGASRDFVIPAPRWGPDGLVESLLLALAPGDHKVTLRLERLDSGEAGEARVSFEVPEPDSPLLLGDPVFLDCGTGGVLAPPAYKDRHTDLCVEVPLMDTRPGAEGDYTVVWTVRSPRGEAVLDSTTSQVGGAGPDTLRLRAPLPGAGRGAFTLRLQVDRGSTRARIEGRFRLDTTRMSYAEDAARVRTVLGYVATRAERIRLERVPDDSLEAVWDTFWARRDRVPETAENETLKTFLERVEYATRTFGGMEPGWQSDMGEIHIRYGAPDRIEQVYGDSVRPRTQIWYYFDRDLSYVFNDIDGLGRYRLAGGRR